MKTAAGIGIFVICLFAAASFALAQQPLQHQTSQSLQQPSQPYQFLPPQVMGPISPQQAPRQPEQEIVYLGHEQARLGVTLADNSQGHVWIRSVIAGSPADRAHLRPGDQIVAMNESNIRSYADAVRFINASHPDQEVTIAFNRGGQSGGTTAVLGWARGIQSNTITVPSGSVQLELQQNGHTYNPEYVYPNNPREYQQPLTYGHQGTGTGVIPPASNGPSNTEAIGGFGTGVR